MDVFLAPEIAWQLLTVGVAPVQDAAVAVAVDRAASIERQHHFQAVRLFPAASVQVPGLPLPKPSGFAVVETTRDAVAIIKLDHHENFRECSHIIF